MNPCPVLRFITKLREVSYSRRDGKIQVGLSPKSDKFLIAFIGVQYGGIENTSSRVASNNCDVGFFVQVVS